MAMMPRARVMTTLAVVGVVALGAGGWIATAQQRDREALAASIAEVEEAAATCVDAESALRKAAEHAEKALAGAELTVDSEAGQALAETVSASLAAVDSCDPEAGDAARGNTLDENTVEENEALTAELVAAAEELESLAADLEAGQASLDDAEGEAVLEAASLAYADAADAAQRAQVKAQGVYADTAGEVSDERTRERLAAALDALQEALDAEASAADDAPWLAQQAELLGAARGELRTAAALVSASHDKWETAQAEAEEAARLAAQQAAQPSGSQPSGSQSTGTSGTGQGTTSQGSAEKEPSEPSPHASTASGGSSTSTSTPVTLKHRSSEARFCRALDEIREAAGSPPLTSCGEWGSLVAHAEDMAEASDIWHSGHDNIVGYAADIPALMEAFLDSDVHLGEILTDGEPAAAKVGCFWRLSDAGDSVYCAASFIS
ncbi:hypothetical protein [Demequina sp. NBRC 110054]|uniref:hypothetical protein n=1 Tax=Demequina sp. NBRC 110054 TaxID=1570343 RepID=UPI001178A6E9|nr:hypothetical protein [Demequina sp. NBRC 110054]